MNPDLLVIAIALGIVVSFLFSEVYGMAAGGVVVPGYVALFFDRPFALALTFAVSFGTYALVKTLSSFLILYGRRRTSLTILVAFALGAWASRIESLPAMLEVDSEDATVVGYIIPGLIAIWFDRQGVAPTAASLAIASVTVRLLLLLLAGPLALELQ